MSSNKAIANFVLLWSVAVVYCDSGTTAGKSDVDPFLNTDLLHTPKFCQQQTFMIENEIFKRILCLPCTQANRFTHEVEIEPCSTTKDTVILCEDSYYRKRISPYENSMGANNDFECTPCRSECENSDLPYEIIPCKNFTNRVCCKDKNMMVVNGRCLGPNTSLQANTWTPEPTVRTPGPTARITGAKVERVRTHGPSVGSPGPIVRTPGLPERTTRPTVQPPHPGNTGTLGHTGKTGQCLVLGIFVVSFFFFIFF